jgi:hypothetical protein
MPRSKKPRVKRAAANPTKKPGWYEGLNGARGQHNERPVKTGKKAENKGQ